MLERLIPGILLLGVAVFLRLGQGTWSTPGAFFCLLWTVQVALSFVIPYYQVWPGTIWWILLSCVVFTTGAGIGALAGRITRGRVKVIDFDRARARAPVIVVLCAILGGAYVVLAEYFGLELSSAQPPLLLQSLLPFQFAGPLLSGVFTRLGLFGRRRWLSAVPLLPALTISILFTGRMAFVAPSLFWVAGYIAVEVWLYRGIPPLFSVRRVGIVIACFVGAIAFGIGVYKLRLARLPGDTVTQRMESYRSTMATADDFDEGWIKIRSAVFGQVYAFSRYFEQAWRIPPEPHLGAITFAAPLDLFQLGGERYPWDNLEVDPGVDSNIFTMFRSPIDDFSVWGSLLWWAAIGLAQGWLFARIAAGRNPEFCVFLGWFYVDTMLIGGYFFRYNSIIVAYCVAAALLRLAIRPRTLHVRPAPLKMPVARLTGLPIARHS